MATITLSYDARNVIAKKTVAYILSLGVFKTVNKTAIDLSLEDVKKQIEPQVLNAKKAKMLTEKFDKALAGASNIDVVAQKLGKTATPVQNMVFANPIIPGLSQENKVVGAVFGSPVAKVSKPIEGDSAVNTLNLSCRIELDNFLYIRSSSIINMFIFVSIHIQLMWFW